MSPPTDPGRLRRAGFSIVVSIAVRPKRLERFCKKAVVRRVAEKHLRRDAPGIADALQLLQDGVQWHPLQRTVADSLDVKLEEEVTQFWDRGHRVFAGVHRVADVEVDADRRVIDRLCD